MAAYVCYRSCCRVIYKQISRSFSTGVQTSCSGQTLHSAGRPALSPLLQFCQSSKFYHSLGQNAWIRKGTAHRSGVFWRGFMSRRNRDTTIIKIGSKNERPGLLRPFAFTAFVCGSSFVGSMIWQYESLRQQAQEVMKGLDRQFGQMFEPTYGKEMGFRAHMNSMWNNMSDGQKMVMGLIAANFAVFLCWKAPAMQPFLMKYFASKPGNPQISMLLSAFSHFNLWHIAANMYVLWSFANISLNLFGREQWMAVYLSAASISAFASLANKVLRGGAIAPSIGASGAIMCLLGAVCVSHPDARLSIAFVGEIYPHSFSASSALKFILLLDTAGLVMGWRMFDHAAHLGGVLFGVWYATYGHKWIWNNREGVMRWWHELRGQPSK
ncbi:presenilin-associated rhomboid-like protein, mitochondrial [Littorina saxatilis]|uniref:rhomboid protease n=1 Tax=Littorina saxatilis TaxID=31220 RepID=A0AAN9G0G9_9CAEN